MQEDPRIVPIGDTKVGKMSRSARETWNTWRGVEGPPVPVVILSQVFEELLQAARELRDPLENARVYRLFMRRRSPRRVVDATRIERVWRNEHGVLRWEEGGYPSRTEPLRKGGNAFIRGDVQVNFSDAWWMGREQTDLRILLGHSLQRIDISAWWARGGTTGLAGKHETDGELWPVHLIVEEHG